MASVIHRFKMVGFLAFWLFGLAACGGGSSSQNKPDDQSGSNDANTGSNTPNASDGALNPTFEGKLFFSDDNGPAYIFNFDTGLSEIIPNTDWVADSPEKFPNSTTDISVIPTYDGEQWPVAAEECHSGLPKGGCIYFQDKFGNYIGSHLEFSTEVKSALPSPDGNYIIVSQNPIINHNSWFEIYNLDGESIDRLDNRKIRYAWLPDNRLVYVDNEDNKERFLFTRPLSFDLEYALELPPLTGDGVIGGFSVSADGKHIAFLLLGESEESKSSVWVMNTDTGELNRFLNIGKGLNTISRPRWSPSGDYIALLQGGQTGIVYPGRKTPLLREVVLTSSDGLFVIPTDNMMTKTYTVSRFDDRSSEVIMLNQRLYPEGPVIDGFPSFDNFIWIE